MTGITPSSFQAEPMSIMQAIQVIASHAAALELERAAGVNLDWGDYPELGEHDWGLVVDAVEGVARDLRPAESDYTEAYALLSARADSSW